MAVASSRYSHVSITLISLLLAVASHASAFVMPQSKTAAFCCTRRSTPHNNPLSSSLRMMVPIDDDYYPITNLMLAGVDLNTAVSDGVRNVVVGITVILVLISAVSLYVTKSYLPEQMNQLALMIQKENPERWQEIESKLLEGERIRDRPDLMAELTNVGVEMMMVESDDELQRLIIMIRDQKEQGQSVGKLREPLEAALDNSIEAFIAKVQANQDSEYLTDAGRELAELLKEEFVTTEPID